MNSRSCVATFISHPVCFFSIVIEWLSWIRRRSEDLFPCLFFTGWEEGILTAELLFSIGVFWGIFSDRKSCYFVVVSNSQLSCDVVLSFSQHFFFLLFVRIPTTKGFSISRLNSPKVRRSVQLRSGSVWTLYLPQIKTNMKEVTSCVFFPWRHLCFYSFSGEQSRRPHLHPDQSLVLLL